MDHNCLKLMVIEKIIKGFFILFKKKELMIS
jgi:hypothetical protein